MSNIKKKVLRNSGLSVSVFLLFLAIESACLGTNQSFFFQDDQILKKKSFFCNESLDNNSDLNIVENFKELDSSFFALTPKSEWDNSAFPSDSSETNDNVDYGANSISFSKDVVVRGSLSLPSFRRFQIWGNAYLGSGHITPKSENRIKNNLNGAMVGLTLSTNSYGKISGYYNYNVGKMNFYDRKSKAKTDLVGLTYSMDAGSVYFNLMGTYGVDSYQWEATNANRYQEFEGYQATGYVESGILMQTTGLFALNPFYSLQYCYLEHDPLNRSTYSLIEGDKTNYDAFYSIMGSRITINLAGMDAFTLQCRLAWIHQMRSQNESIQNIWFGRTPGSILPTQVYYEGAAGRDYFWGGTGLRLGLASLLALSIDYDVLVNSYQTTHLGSAGLLISF